MGDYVELEGVRTWYDDQGVGSPLVLLHGGLMTNESWFAQMPVLSSEWHVYAPERRAHGRTPDVDGPISFDDMATDTIRFLESVVGEPAALVGWSHRGISWSPGLDRQTGSRFEARGHRHQFRHQRDGLRR